MQFRLFKLRFRRRFRHGQKQVEDLGLQAEENLEQLFFKRLSSLGKARRFITTWILFLVILIGCLAAQIETLSNHYQTLQPIPGGSYTEGLLGTFTNANPLYATSDVDTTVSHLLFSGLFTYNDQNQLVGALASGWTVNEKGTVYTVTLKPNLTWQDGTPITADDVVFTYHAIQNPDAESPLATSWQNITVAKVNENTVTFTLPNPLSSFPYSLTNGIVPAHAFASLPATDWRSANFNSVHPIGSGPFEWSALQVVSDSTGDNAQILIALRPFAGYEGGKPKLDEFIVHIFSDQQDLLNAFKNQELTSVSLPSPPVSLTSNSALHQYSFVETAATMAFFNNSTGVLANPPVRQALVQATNVPAIISGLGYSTVAVREPLLQGQLAYDPAYQQGYNPTAAATALTAAGWVVGPNGIREKAGVPLEFTLTTTTDPEYQKVAEELQRQWQAVGAKVDLSFQQAEDFQSTLSNHSYDALLYSISIGVDPDVFVYWDSSQTDPRSTGLNFSFYKSTTADSALEAGRTRLDPALRILKYRPFLQAWQTDAPAVGLYQPRYLYISHDTVYGLNEHMINSDTDRFDNVQNWMIRTARVTNP